jgi:CheY-like chemotaxis protein
MKLLIAEDNFQMRQLLKALLKGVSDEVYECEDGSAALALYRQHQPDWVLMDIEMQPLDGLTASRQLRESFPEARILIVTNYDDDALREQARQAGVADYVLKENLLALRQRLQTAI